MKKVSLFVLFAVLLYPLLAFPSVSADQYGSSSNSSSSSSSDGGAPQCTETYTQQPVLYQPNHRILPKAKNRGEVRLWWHPTSEGSNYNVYIGMSPGNYIHSARNIGNGQSNNFTVEYLQNKKYYFAVQANKGCGAGPMSNEWMGKPTRGGYIAPRVKKT